MASPWPGSGGPLGGVILGPPRSPYPGGGGRGSYPGSTGPHTKSAGTAEIARQSGGDSMQVDGAYALEDTLQRIRQRYALHFNLPAGARSGDQRSISVALSDATLRRYPYAELRYRREYVVPSGVTPSRGSSDPAVISRAPVSDPDRPVQRRRGVSQSDGDSPVPNLSRPDAADPAPAPSAAPPTASQSPAQQPPARKPASGRWRKVSPAEPQQQN